MLTAVSLTLNWLIQILNQIIQNDYEANHSNISEANYSDKTWIKSFGSILNQIIQTSCEANHSDCF